MGAESDASILSATTLSWMGPTMTTAVSAPTLASLQAQLAALAAENAALKARPSAKLSLKVSAKGAVSVYGLGRWPVTLYSSQMRRFLAISGDIETFMLANASRLTEKGDDATAEVAVAATTAASPVTSIVRR